MVSAWLRKEFTSTATSLAVPVESIANKAVVPMPGVDSRRARSARFGIRARTRVGYMSLPSRAFVVR